MANPQPTLPSGDSLAALRDHTRSSYREQLVEYLFLSELLLDGWLRRRQQVDVLRADVDGAGYDLVAECQGVMRHVQLKSSVTGGRASAQNVNLGLAAQPSGCVVWLVIEPGDANRLVRLSYRVLGGGPGAPLIGLEAHRIGRHAKANAQGYKAERPRIRTVPRSEFREIGSIADLSDWLFGAPAPAPTHKAPPRAASAGVATGPGGSHFR